MRPLDSRGFPIPSSGVDRSWRSPDRSVTLCPSNWPRHLRFTWPMASRTADRGIPKTTSGRARKNLGVVADRPIEASSVCVRKSMQAIKGRDTKPELAVRKALHSQGFRYRVSTRPLPELRRTADMVFSRARVAVFVDGCFWHGCPQHHTVAV